MDHAPAPGASTGPSRPWLVEARPRGHAMAVAAVVMSMGMAAAHADLIDDLPAGTGYAAWELCTRAIASSDNYLRVRWSYTVPKVQPLPSVWDVDFHPRSRAEVRTIVPFLAHRRTALYRPGLGCTLVTPDARVADVLAQPFQPVPVAPPRPGPWPTGEGPAEAGRLSFQQAELLTRHGDRLFEETTTKTGTKQNTIAVLVARDGHLLYERYGSGYERSQPQLGWSMTKSLTALMAAVMASEGRLSLDAPVGLPQWNGAKAAITWKQLLNMAPGLAWDEGYAGASDATEMLFSQADQGAWAAQRPMTSPPGTVMTYSTGFANVAMLRMRQLLGGSHQAVYDYYQQRLFAPLGIRDGVIEPDASGTPVGGARGVLRPVDWLRLGQWVAQGGRWGEQHIISSPVMEFLLAPSPASSAYGGFIWRRSPADDIPAALRPAIPDDTVWFAGHMGQLMVIVPSRQLVVLRMGVSFDTADTRQRVFSAVADLLSMP